MPTPHPTHPLADEIAQLPAIIRGLASEDEAEQEAAAAQAADAARLAAMLIRAVEAEHELGHTTDAHAETALAAIIARTLDALDTLGTDHASLDPHSILAPNERLT
jgi:D-alanyl-D-alanine carboxypeptidase